MNLNTRKKNGFTMIELIAVIVILGILAAAAVPRFMDARDEARTAAAQGIAAAWLSQCSAAAATAMLEDGTMACPQQGDINISQFDDDDAYTLTAVRGATEAGEGEDPTPLDTCDLTVSHPGLDADVEVTFQAPAGVAVES